MCSTSTLSGSKVSNRNLGMVDLLLTDLIILNSTKVSIIQ